MDKEEASEILQKLISRLEKVIDLYRNKYPDGIWYRDLVERKNLLFLKKDEELNLIQLSLRKELGPLSRKGVPGEMDAFVTVKLDDLDAALLKQSRSPRARQHYQHHQLTAWVATTEMLSLTPRTLYKTGILGQPLLLWNSSTVLSGYSPTGRLSTLTHFLVLP